MALADDNQQTGTQHQHKTKSVLHAVTNHHCTSWLAACSRFDIAAALAQINTQSLFLQQKCCEVPPPAHPSSLDALSLCSKYCLSVPSNDSTAEASQQHGTTHVFEQQTSQYVLPTAMGYKCSSSLRLGHQMPYFKTAAEHADQTAS
jgi:hypothetical protein